jgi:hypothetical protein
MSFISVRKLYLPGSMGSACGIRIYLHCGNPRQFNLDISASKTGVSVPKCCSSLTIITEERVLDARDGANCRKLPSLVIPLLDECRIRPTLNHAGLGEECFSPLLWL